MKDDGLAIVEDNVEETCIDAISRIDVNVDLRFDAGVYFKSPANEICRSNGRMVRYLLSVNRASPDISLIGLSQNWVERLLYIAVHDAITETIS